tara:strand:- start:8673 stop:8927 length:255 start_codon:yes stop_codon:yes gene_type:complete
MSWGNVVIDLMGDSFVAHRHLGRPMEFAFPYRSGTIPGQVFSDGLREYEVLTTENWAGRNEILLVTAKELEKKKERKRNESEAR